MKITYTVWVSEHQHHTVTREIDSYDDAGILADFDRACDLRELRAENGVLKRAVKKLEDDKIPVEFPKRDCAPHNPFRVFEYDGAFWCLDCSCQWGALPGRPIMPTECIKKSDEIKL